LFRVVRRDSIVGWLAVPAACEAYFIAAPHLPSPGSNDFAFWVTSIPALVLASAIVVWALPARQQPPRLAALVAVGAIGAAVLSSPAPEAAAPFKAMFAAGVGFALARAIPVGSVVYLLAVAVAIADAVSVSMGPTHYLVTQRPDVVDYLALTIPAWGGAFSQLGISDLVFFAVYLLTAWRFGLRRAITAAALTLSLVCALAIAVLAHVTVPALPLLSLALLAPNLDLVWTSLREDLRKID
jgi:hypothetical protein